MHQSAIHIIYTLIATVYVVQLKTLDMLSFVIGAGTYHDSRAYVILPSTFREQMSLVYTRLGFCVEIHVGFVV